MSDVVTQGIRIQAEPTFIPEHSGGDRWFFSYTVRISNVGDSPAKLISRHWIIRDGWDTVEVVKGPGVVGEQPRLAPQESFEYTSYCPLPTPTGSMEGTYQMTRDDGEIFDAVVGRFTLQDPSLV